MIVWALFDSGNGSYTKAADDFPEIEIYPVGIDIEKKNNHFINLDLADYGRLFGDNKLFDELDKLPKPDLIIASPPCESWSNASAMDRGNACWKQEKGDTLFEPQVPLSRFTVRDYLDYDKYQFKPDKSFLKRINGELTIFNTLEIIKRYNPSFYLIENPAYGRIWEYIERVQGFKLPFKNLTYYNNYDYPVSKATRFSGNIDLGLKFEKISNEINFKKDFPKSYNERSNIPQKLVREIFAKVLKEVKNERYVY